MKFPYLIPPIGFIEIVDLSFPGKTMLFLKQRKQLAAKIKSTLFNDRQFQFFIFLFVVAKTQVEAVLWSMRLFAYFSDAYVYP